MLAAGRHRGDDIIGSPRHNQADRNLAIIGSIGCVQRTASEIETNLALYAVPQGRFEGGGRSERFDWLSVRDQTAGSGTGVLPRLGVDSSPSPSFGLIQNARIAPNISRPIPATNVNSQWPVLSMM